MCSSGNLLSGATAAGPGGTLARVQPKSLVTLTLTGLTLGSNCSTNFLAASVRNPSSSTSPLSLSGVNQSLGALAEVLHKLHTAAWMELSNHLSASGLPASSQASKTFLPASVSLKLLGLSLLTGSMSPWTSSANKMNKTFSASSYSPVATSATSTSSLPLNFSKTCMYSLFSSTVFLRHGSPTGV